jgi:TolA-binding protein
VKRAIVAILLVALPSFGQGNGAMLLAKEVQKTEEIINNILNESSDDKPADAKKAEPTDAAGIDKKESAPPAAEKKTTPVPVPARSKKDVPAKQEGAPKVTNQEQVLFKTGVDFYNNGMYEQSLKMFQDLGSKFPQGMLKDSAHFWKGKVYLKQYRYDDAIKELSAVTAESGDYPASIYYAGESYQMKGDQLTSIEYYQRVQAQFPSHELADKALLNIGRLYLNQQKGTQALDSAVKIIKYYKDRGTVDDAYYLMGKVYEKDPQLKDIETARKVYKLFLKKSGTDDRFGSSPLKKRVEEDLRRLDRLYFNMEK